MAQKKQTTPPIPNRDRAIRASWLSRVPINGRRFRRTRPRAMTSETRFLKTTLSKTSTSDASLTNRPMTANAKADVSAYHRALDRLSTNRILY